MTARAMCSRCVLSEHAPDIRLDADGVCNVCHQFESEQEPAGQKQRGYLETDFTKILSKYRGKQKYDCLVMLSGGKDSTSALYTIVRRYKLNPLAFTFNHGFVPDEHLACIKNTVRALGVDHLYFESAHMHQMFREILKTSPETVICPVCSLWYMLTTYEIAGRYKIPLIISGWTKGQTTGSTRSALTTCACNQTSPEHASMAAATKTFMARAVKTLPRYRGFPFNMEAVLKIAKKQYKSKALALSPHWFLPTDAAEYVETIKAELGWSYPACSYPKRSTNCELNYVSTYLAMKHYGFSHYHIEMSNMIRRGLMTREEALELLDTEFLDRDLLEPILNKLDCSFSDLQA